MFDLFASCAAPADDYDAQAIEVLDLSFSDSLRTLRTAQKHLMLALTGSRLTAPAA